MFDFLSRGRSKSGNNGPTALPPGRPSPVPEPSAAQREMVRMTLNSALRKKGIPVNWMTCEIIPIQVAGPRDAALVQMVVLKWHDSLMQYAPALQLGFLEGLKHFDADANAAKYHFSWSFAADCGFPHTQFPDPSFWNADTAPAPITPTEATRAAATVVATNPAQSKPKFDLPATAADRRNTDDDDDDHGFAATQVNDI